jgi:hypothetical protein
VYDSGGSNPEERAAGLTELGLPSELSESTPETIQDAVETGKGAIVAVWADTLWAKDGKVIQDGAHAITVIGLIRDEEGNIESYVINDTGKGWCGKRIPKEHFENSLRKGRPMVQTRSAIW